MIRLRGLFDGRLLEEAVRTAVLIAAISFQGCAKCGADPPVEDRRAEPVAPAASPGEYASSDPSPEVAPTLWTADAGQVAPGPDDCWAPGDIVELQLEARGFPVKGLRFEGPECDDELEAAVGRGDLAVVRTMIEEVQIPDHWPARSPRCRTAELGNLLHLSAASGSTQVTEYLISKGSNVRGCDRRGATPLHVAAANLDAPTARLLVEKGALVDAVDIEGRRPIHRCFDNRFLKPARSEIDPATRRAAGELAAWLRERSALPGAK